MEVNNYKKVQKVLFVILLANLLVAVLKLVVGAIIKSASMTADGFHSISDGSSNLVGLIGIYFASQPEDVDHPYGHNKYETLAGIFISFMLFLAGFRVILGAIGRFREPVIPEVSIASLIALVLTLVVNIFVCTLEYRKGKELDSQILISDSMHTRSDIFISVGVLLTLIGIRLGFPPIIDPIVSLVVAGFIMHAGYEIFKENSGVLVDEVAVDSDEIKNVVMTFEEVKDAHKIRSRGSLNDLNIDLHIQVDASLDVERSHELVHDIEEAIRSRFHRNSEVIVHVEPYKED